MNASNNSGQKQYIEYPNALNATRSIQENVDTSDMHVISVVRRVT